MEQIVLVEVPSKKVSYNETLTADFLQFIGQVVGAFNCGQKFEFLGCEIKVPGLSSSVDKVLRVYSTLAQMNKAIFGEMENDTIAEPDTIQFKWIEALRAKGFKISHESKAAAHEAIRIWKELKQRRTGEQINATRLMNVQKLAEIKSLKDLKTGERVKSAVKMLVAEAN